MSYSLLLYPIWRMKNKKDELSRNSRRFYWAALFVV